jgi:hypothetical protein
MLWPSLPWALATRTGGRTTAATVSPCTSDWKRSPTTPDYTTALPEPYGLLGDLALRKERQHHLLTRTPPQRLVAVVGAAALTRPVGGAAVLAEQTACLHDLSRRDNIDIRVLPWEAGAHPAMRIGAFAILDFHHDEDPAVVHAETHTGARYLEKPDELAEYRRVFDLIYRKTVPIESYRPPNPQTSCRV